MSLHSIEKLYEGAVLTAPTFGVAGFRSPITGTIVSVVIFHSDSTSSGAATWNITQNAVQLWTGVSRPGIAAGVESVSKTGLSISVVKGDKFVLNLEANVGAIQSPVTVIMVIDDGAGATPMALDDLTDVDTTGELTGDVLTYNGTLWVPAAPTGGGGGSSRILYSDDFSAGSIDTTINWDTPPGGASQSGGVVALTASSTIYLRSKNLIPLYDCRVSAKLVPTVPNNANAVQGILCDLSGTGSFGSSYYSVDVYQGVLRGHSTLGNWGFTKSYNAVNDLYFGIRFEAGGVSFQTSPDGVAWNTYGLGQVTGTNDLSMYVYLRMFVSSGTFTGTFDDYKVEVFDS